MILLKYIHQNINSLPDIRPGDTPDTAQYRRNSKFIPKSIHELFGYHRLRNYSDVITTSMHGDLNIGGSPPIKLG